MKKLLLSLICTTWVEKARAFHKYETFVPFQISHHLFPVRESHGGCEYDGHDGLLDAGCQPDQLHDRRG